MIINVTHGNAEGIGRYIQGPAKEHGRNVSGTEDRARIIEGKGFGFPVHSQDDVDLARDVMRKDLDLQASNTKRITNTGIHSSMSWPQGYQPTRDEMRQAVDGLAKAWDMEGARRISWSHDDTKHRHLHTLWGSVNPDTGRAYHDHERNDRAQREAIRQEKEHGPLPPSRQRDHDIAQAAETSDHARTLELSKATDGSISRVRLDRALALGGHFGPDRGAQRNEFINQNDMTKFPRHRGQAYAPQEVASEKRDYIRDNREAASNLTRAYSREAKERARGVAGLYEDHSFEKTSQPPTQKERERNMGRINDALDWPWKKAGEAIRKKWQDLRPQRDFGKEVEKKGWDHPEVKRQWEKQYGPKREEKREPSRWQDRAEEVRVKNWKTQRERKDAPANGIPPWREEEQRSAAWRRQKEMDEASRAAEKLRPQQEQENPISKWYKDQMAKPRPDHDVPLPPRRAKPTPEPTREEVERWNRTTENVPPPPALPRPREVPMPKIEPRDYVPQPQGKQEPKSMKLPTPEQIAAGNRSKPVPTPEQTRNAMDAIEKGTLPPPKQVKWKDISGQTPEQDFNTQVRQANEGKETLHPPKPINHEYADGKWRMKPEGKQEPEQKDIEENWKRDLDKINKELGKEQAEREEQGRELPRSPGKESGEDWVPPRLRKLHNQNDIAREESRADGTAGKGRLDDTAAGRPGILPGGSHEHGSPSQQFRDQLNESLRKIKIPEREVGKEQERER